MEAEIFYKLCILCPDFYYIGLQEGLLLIKIPEETAHFICKINKHMLDIFLPDRRRFLYYNEMLKDLPIVFDTGATVLVTTSQDDFVKYKPGTDMLYNISGNTMVLGYGIVFWMIYNDDSVAHKI